MADDTEVINFSALERELQWALEADKKYQRENDAKFRALHQNVGSYEEFRDIVLASHLRPLDKKDKTGGPRKQPWNSIATSSSTSSTRTQTDENSIQRESQAQSQSQVQPQTAYELNRVWRQLAGDSGGRYALLLALGGPGLRDIFRAEVGFGLLGELLVVLCEGLQPGDEARVAGVLEGLTQTPRFSLNLALISPAERRACDRLLPLVAKAAQHVRAEEPTQAEGKKGTFPVEENEGEGKRVSEEEKERRSHVEGQEQLTKETRREEERDSEGERERRCYTEESERCVAAGRDKDTAELGFEDLMQLYGIQPGSIL